MRRRRESKREYDDFHYNGGETPLQTVLFGAVDPQVSAVDARRRLKWVFTVNAEASDVFVDATRVAVTSALRNTRLVPVCLHLGPFGRLAHWLQRQPDVRVVQQAAPSWMAFVTTAAQTATSHRGASTNYLDPHMMAATFARFDVLALELVDEYVLYADVDVLFLAHVSLADFAPLPAYYAVGTEFEDEPMPFSTKGDAFAFGNAGVMLLHVSAMRRTHFEFLNWTFRAEHVAKALDFGRYGPLDQGALNAFYQGRFDVHKAPSFNWKPYWGYNDRAKIVHFHGPKPEEYVRHRHAPTKDNANMAPIFKACDHTTKCYTHVHTWLRVRRSAPS